MDFEEALKTVRPFKPREDFARYVPTQGISLNFIMTNLGELQAVENMYDLEHYILRITQRDHCSFAELLEQHETFKNCVKPNAEYFISFAYSTSFQTILSALEKFRRKLNVKDISVWISILTINQHFGRAKNELAPIVYPKSWFKNAFETCIVRLRKVLFVMSPIHNPVALQRLWCIYELYLTVLYEGCTLDVILSEEDERSFIDGLLEDTESILKYINVIDAAAAKSSNPAQEMKLRERIEGETGGYDKINNEVRDKLRSWFAHAAKSFIETNKEEYQKETTKYIELVRMVSKMLAEAGRFEDAELFCYEDMYACIDKYGNESRE